MQPADNITYVPSLDGLRTIAVGLVIAFHLSVPNLELGFAGVDVFFVLSGYLITSGLLRDTVRHGRPQYGKFWQRRFRRLLPAATLILLLVLLYATFLMPLFRKANASWDIFWTVLYLGNWRFMGANSYFASDGTPSLLLHMWSLAVEEQFYFFWPVLIGIVAFVAAKLGGSKRVTTIIGVVAAVLIVVSAALLMVLYDPASPDRAYMGTDTKAFEPLLGALLAIVMSNHAVRTVFYRHHRLIAAVGVVTAVAVLPFLAGPSAFYFQGGAVILSVGVTLLIGALVVSPPTMLSGFLSWRPMTYLGQISYGLYLWHWPWSVWLDVAHKEEFRMLRAPVALAATLICAVLSYHFVEEPIRRGRFTTWLTFKRTMLTVAVIMVIIMTWATALRGLPVPSTRPPATPVSPGGSPVPQTNPDLLIVVGDSVPFRLMESLDQVASDNDFVVDNASRGGCPPLSIELQEYLKPDHEGAGDCTMVADIQTEKIDSERPATVFWWSRYEVHQRWLDGRIVGPDEEIFWEALEEDLAASVDRLTSQGATLVIAQTERPGTGMLSRCTEDECHPLLDLMVNHDEYRRRWNDIVVDLAQRDDRVETFRMDPLLCKDPEPESADGPALCDDSRPGGQLLRPDGSHILVDPFGYETAEKVLENVLTAASS
ncbi:acyltransferase [Tessaracoccus sp. MC1865]|uniref:acyltransferase family protein n=1 Tax=unclassified Tessaracoccus TaxID=2635419 RepID=UPI0016031C0D|nr:acyltransferase family protein [Tessaracoccus sp. MC1865]MBB1483709.1 acyltransferase [Tessaracoccus sp. MC1865]MBB1508780.1 acyltransferase [Tessaracoccus sp. MC1756]QTO36778.1 acyltransferase [Tessaracoccus sp. MC1865]